MNLLELLLATQSADDTTYKLIHSQKTRVINEAVVDLNEIECSTVIPSAQDTSAIINLAKIYTLDKTNSGVTDIINSALLSYDRSNYNDKLEAVKYIQELLLATINHKCFDTKLIYEVKGCAKYVFYSLVPILTFNAVEAIIKGKNYVELYEAVHILIATCAAACDIPTKDIFNYRIGLSCVNDDLIIVRFGKHPMSFREFDYNSMEHYEDVKNMKITEEHFEKYVKVLNLYLTKHNYRINDDSDF